jgi:hypothetical protein
MYNIYLGEFPSDFHIPEYDLHNSYGIISLLDGVGLRMSGQFSANNYRSIHSKPTLLSSQGIARHDCFDSVTRVTCEKNWQLQVEIDFGGISPRIEYR